MKQPLFQRVYRQLLGHPVARWFIILGSIAYLLSPIDFSPDIIPILGWVDDGVLAALVATGITEIILERRRAVKSRKTTEEAPPSILEATAVSQDAGENDSVLEATASASEAGEDTEG